MEQFYNGTWSDFSATENLPYIVEFDLPLRPVQWPSSEGGNDNYYVRIDETATWEEARDIAENMWFLGNRGHLVTITSQAETDFVAENFLDTFNDIIWIGLSDIETEGDFVWVTGEPLDYTNWSDNEPNGGVSENAVVLLANIPKVWFDYPEASLLRYIVEFEPGPLLHRDGFEDPLSGCVPVP